MSVGVNVSLFKCLCKCLWVYINFIGLQGPQFEMDLVSLMEACLAVLDACISGWETAALARLRKVNRNLSLFALTAHLRACTVQRTGYKNGTHVEVARLLRDTTLQKLTVRLSISGI